MKQGPNNRRQRSGRGGGGGRRPYNAGHGNRSLESSGPNVKLRGSANQIWDKYLALARDASSAGDRIAAENYYQHAEHYYRLMTANGQNNHNPEEEATRPPVVAAVLEGGNGAPPQEGANGAPPQDGGNGAPPSTAELRPDESDREEEETPLS